MHRLQVEQYRILAKDSIAVKVTRHLYMHSSPGRVIIVAEKPFAMLSAVRKQWVLLERKVQVERAKSLDASKIQALSSRIAYMRGMHFTAKLPEDQLEADVTFATADDMVRMAPDCHLMYVTYAFPKEKLYVMTAWMPSQALVVIYEKG